MCLFNATCVPYFVDRLFGWVYVNLVVIFEWKIEHVLFINL